jgi:hypothetical protein
MIAAGSMTRRRSTMLSNKDPERDRTAKPIEFAPIALWVRKSSFCEQKEAKKPCQLSGAN